MRNLVLIGLSLFTAPAFAQFDFQQLMSIPQVKQLLKNPQVQGLVKKMGPMLAGSSHSPRRARQDVAAPPDTGTSQFDGGYNIRSGPGTDYRRLGLVRNYEGEITPTGRRSANGRWVQVEYGNNKKGWVSAKALKQETNPEPQPSAVARNEKLPKRELATTAIDATKPQCAESRAELEANESLKKALNGYTPFANWKGANADIKFNEQTGKMQTVIKPGPAKMAAMFGIPAVTPLAVKVCTNAGGANPYVSIGGTVYKKLENEVTLSNEHGSETFKIETTR